MMNYADCLQDDLSSAKKKGFQTVLTITNSAHETSNYLAPIRLYKNTCMTGLVSSDLELIEATLSRVRFFLDWVFIDIEKKIPPKFGSEFMESGNHFDILASKFIDVPLLPIAPNNLTVNAVISSVLKQKITNKGLTVGVVGMGNIGFKVSQRCVEMGCDTFIFPKQIGYREVACENAINFTKPSGTIASAHLINSLEKLVMVSDVVVITSPHAKIITQKNYLSFKDKMQIIDVGKGNIDISVVPHLSNLEWLDVGKELQKYVAQEITMAEANVLQKEAQDKLPSKVRQSGTLAMPEDTLAAFNGENFYSFADINSEGEYKRLRFNEIKKFKN